jgi:hypothetical protein
MIFIFGCFCVSSCATKSVYEPVADREGIKLVVREHFGELEHCYLHAIDARPGAEGKVVMSWDVQPDGRVANARVQESSKKMDVIGPCLISRIEKWNFPKLSEEEISVGVTYPFYFSENGNFDTSKARPDPASVTK